jgi:precorrin-2 dehydrogenase/sirohydrochlorin ferrochelatase
MTAAHHAQMYPLMLNVTGLTIFVIGSDGAADDRVAALVDHGAQHVLRFADQLPTPEDFAAHAPRLVFLTNTPAEARAEIHRLAKAHGALVHAQDHIPLCDFHLPARLRRGRMLITVSTDGAVAGLSRLVRDYLANFIFGEEWSGRVDELATARQNWKANGLTMGTLFQAITCHVAERGWLPRLLDSTATANTESSTELFGRHR